MPSNAADRNACNVLPDRNRNRLPMVAASEFGVSPAASTSSARPSRNSTWPSRTSASTNSRT
jgi:hypothetical protein